MVSPRDGAVRHMHSGPDGEVERMLSLFRKWNSRQSEDGAEIWQSMDAGEREAALCAVTASWQEISRYLPGYFDPRKELARTAAQTHTFPAEAPARLSARK